MEMIESKNKFNLKYFLIIFFGILILQNFLQNRAITSVAYSEFYHLLKEGKIKEVMISNESMKGVLRDADIDKNKSL